MKPHVKLERSPHRVKLMPLKVVVCQLTNEADPRDPQAVRQAVKKWHNKLANGSIPRFLFKKIGKELFLDVIAFETWLNESGEGEK